MKALLKNRGAKRVFGARVLLALILVFSVAVLGGCGSSDSVEGGSHDGAKPVVVATTTFLADLARVLVGDQLEVVSLMGVGIDPHQYQASAGDVDKLTGADIVLYHGLHLEGKMTDIFAGLIRQNKQVISVEAALSPDDLLADEDNPDAYDPHVWFDVALWKKTAQYVAAGFSTVPGIDAGKIAANLSAYELLLDDLDAYIVQRLSELRPEQRVLITAHDAFRYFGNAYGVEVRALQGISTEAEAGIKDVTALADFITERDIRAVFIESSVPHKSIESLRDAVLSRGGKVQLGGELYSDSLGDKESGHDSYIETVKANIDTIVDALKSKE